MSDLTAIRTRPEWRISAGLTDYPTALQAMRDRAAAIRAGSAAELVWLLEHPPLYTAGTSARPDDLTDPARFPTYDAGRGGQWTYHGPGQRTAYVMLDLQQRHHTVPPRDVRCYVHALEEWLIQTLRHFDISGERRPGRVGIWVQTGATEAKIAAIGVRLTKWVSFHGVAINLNPDLSHFDGIIPCGVRDHGVTSLHALGKPATMSALDTALQTTWPEIF